jgi:hypothetical protein
MSKLNKKQFLTPKPPKASGNELNEVTGPVNKEGKDVGTKPDVQAAARKTFF